LKKDLKAYFFLAPVSGFIVALDQWTKSIVESNLEFNETWMPVEWLRPYLRIVHWKNTGAAFGIGQGLNVFFMLLSLVVIVVIIYYFPRIPRSDVFFKVALSMQLGGAIGNLSDRFTQGYVTDFISVGTFPVFNVADSCITVGVGVLLLGMWLEEREPQDE
jgi:signal peptidase II